MYRYISLFLLVTVLVEHTISIADDGRPYQYNTYRNKEDSRLPRTSGHTHHLGKTRETRQAHTHNRIKQNTEFTDYREFAHSEDVHKSHIDTLRRNAQLTKSRHQHEDETDFHPDQLPRNSQSTKTTPEVSQLADENDFHIAHLWKYIPPPRTTHIEDENETHSVNLRRDAKFTKVLREATQLKKESNDQPGDLQQNNQLTNRWRDYRSQIENENDTHLGKLHRRSTQDKTSSNLLHENTSQLDYENRTHLAKLHQRSTQDKTSYDEINNRSVPNRRGIRRRIHRRSFANVTKSTPADITSLFEGNSKDSMDISHFVEGGGMPRESWAMSTPTSPKQASSTINGILVNKSMESRSRAHLVEGGGEPLDEATTSSTTSLPTSTYDNLSVNPDKIKTNTAKDDSKSHKTVPRKGAEVAKSFGRKGVHEINFDAGPSNPDNSPSLLPLAINITTKGAIPSQLVSLSKDASPLSSSEKEVIIEANPPLKKKPNAKPLTLSDRTSFNTTPVPTGHVPSQRDLVIPVVGLILAVPLITILGIFLYKKGSEFWSRRHYRRMDFLIDGMYND